MFKKVLLFLLASLKAGIVFLLPLAVIGFVLRQVFIMLEIATKPLLPYFSNFPLGGMGAATFVESVAFVFICLIAGFMSDTAQGRRLYGWIEGNLLQFIPGYWMFRTLLIDLAGRHEEAGVLVVLARIEDAWQLAFLIETLESGLSAVFVPESPSVSTGSVYYLTEDRIKRTKIPVHSAFRSIRQYGAGSQSLFKNIV